MCMWRNLPSPKCIRASRYSWSHCMGPPTAPLASSFRQSLFRWGAVRHIGRWWRGPRLPQPLCPRRLVLAYLREGNQVGGYGNYKAHSSLCRNHHLHAQLDRLVNDDNVCPCSVSTFFLYLWPSASSNCMPPSCFGLLSAHRGIVASSSQHPVNICRNNPHHATLPQCGSLWAYTFSVSFTLASPHIFRFGRDIPIGVTSRIIPSS